MKISAKPTFRTVVILAAILVVVIILGLFVSGVFSGSREPLYLAVVGPMTGPDKASGVDMVRSINLYLEQANREGGVDGKPVRLLVFDDQSNPSLAGQKALEIAQQKKALVVIGHLFSSTSVKGGEVYKQYGIPAITGSATTENVTADNEWYFRTIFSNHSQASYLANYVRQVLKQGTVSIIYDQDDYGTSLADGFDAKFRELGGTIKYRWSFNSQTEDTTGALSGIEQELVRAKGDDPGTIFIAAHGNESEKIVVAIRRNGLAYPIVGGDTMGDDSFAAQFKSYAEEKERPGYYTDGIYAASPIIFDVAGEKAQQLRSEYRARYGTDPGWTVTAFYDAALVAVQGMKQARVHGDSARLSEERKSIRDQLASFNRIDKAVAGANGNLYFDGQRGLANSVCMGTFMRGQFISAMTQFEPVTDPRGVNDLQGEMQAGRILLVDGQYMYKTRVVYTGVDLNQVTNLDTKTSTYNMDFYLWFRYQGQFDDSDIDFENADKEITIGQPIDEVAAGDVMYRLYRVKADFRGNFLFRDYPFDQQELAVRFRHNSEARDRLVYVVDRAGMRHMSSPSLLQEWAQAFNGLGYWKPIWAGLFQDVAETGSSMGNPRLLAVDANADMDASRFNLVIWVKRDVLNFTIKNLFPVFIVIGVSYLVFFIPPREIGTRIGLGTSTLLTTAFFDLSLSSHLPDIGYVVAVEYFFYVVYLLAVFGIMVTISGFIEAKAEKHGEKEALIKRLNLIGKFVYPAVIFITFAIYVYFYGLARLLPPA